MALWWALYRQTLWASPGFVLEGDAFRSVRAMEGETFREVAGRRTLRFFQEGQGYFLKYHQGVGWREIAKNLLALRLPIISAESEWRAIQRLEDAGVPTMKVVAYGKRGCNPASIESFVITEELRATVSLEDFTRDWIARPPAPRLKRILIGSVADMCRRMHRAGINHRDLYLCHFMLDKEELAAERIHISLIDLHRAQLREAVPLRWRNKDLAALYSSAIHIGLTKRDLLRFLRGYFDKPLRDVLGSEARSLAWLQTEGEFLRGKFLRKYAQ